VHQFWREFPNADLLLAFWASIGFKPGDFMTAGMNEKRSTWFYRVLDRVMPQRSPRAFIRSEPPNIKVFTMAKMTKNQLIDAIAEGTQVSKGDVKAVIEQMVTVGYKELNESGEFVVPGFVKMSVVNKPATEARSGVNPFTKEPMEFAAKPASKSVKASPLKVAKDAV
jgi:nucleoid DNA-binding protein